MPPCGAFKAATTLQAPAFQAKNGPTAGWASA